VFGEDILVRGELQALGYRVLTTEETRRVVNMPHPAETLFLDAMRATQDLNLFRNDLGNTTIAAFKNALRPLRHHFDDLEKATTNELTQFHLYVDDKSDTTKLAQGLFQHSALYIRNFIEEKDRYPSQADTVPGKFARHIHKISLLNYTIELLAEAGHDTGSFELEL